MQKRAINHHLQVSGHFSQFCGKKNKKYSNFEFETVHILYLKTNARIQNKMAGQNLIA